MEAFPRPLEFGQYRLYAKVGSGGMAEVFLATCNRPELQNQFVAVKKLHGPLNANKPFVNLLVHEAKIGVLLGHPGIAEVYDLGSHKSEFFLAMEYIHGKSLDKVLQKVRDQACPLPTRDVATFVMFEILRALAFAHALKDIKGRELNIIHRDVSPGNILLEYKGNVKLTDFGIATAENRLHVEFSNVALGKLVYIPPEQAVNDPVVRASDLYSLSVVYYELLTGRLPFESESPSGLYRDIVAGKVEDLRSINPEVPKELSELIHKNLDKSARKRFQSAPEMFEAFHGYFLKKENLDFNSRATRAYFQKKLAE
jgi:eukaryotic-like serine/threonine-protein kinase